jgi:membrane protein DedA with SNARE-associated domain
VAFLSGFVFLSDSSNLVVDTLVLTLVLTLGMTIGSFLVYFVVYYGGRPIVEKWGKYVGLSWEDINSLEKHVEGSKKFLVGLFLFRSFPIAPSVVFAAFCGFIRLPFKVYVALTISGAFLRTLFLVIVGLKVGEVYTEYADIFESFEKYILIAVVLCVVSFIWYRWSKRGKVSIIE